MFLDCLLASSAHITNVQVRSLSLAGRPKVGEMLIEIGILKVTDLKNHSPDKLYEQICNYRGEILDRCVLYHFRCAVYFATNKHHKPELLKWWSWKNE